MVNPPGRISEVFWVVVWIADEAEELVMGQIFVCGESRVVDCMRDLVIPVHCILFP